MALLDDLLDHATIYDIEDDEEDPVWVTRDKRTIPLREMSDRHLANTINFLRVRGARTAEEVTASPIADAEFSMSRFNAGTQKKLSQLLREQQRRKDALAEKKKKEAEMHSTITDLVKEVAERFGVPRTAAGLEDAVRAQVPGRYEEVKVTGPFLCAVWDSWGQAGDWPFGADAAVSDPLRQSLSNYLQAVRALGGYGARVQATMPDGQIRVGALVEAGIGGLQPALKDDNDRLWVIASIADARRVEA